MTSLSARAGAATAVALALVVVGGVASRVEAQPAPSGEPPKSAPVKLGLLVNDPKAYQGYTLLNTLKTKKAHLIDMTGRVVRTWESDCESVHCGYLLENGHLFRLGAIEGAEQKFGGGPGAAGRVQEYTWDGDLVWDYRLFSDKQLPHHDAIKLPSGHVLMIVWDKKTAKEAIAAGRKPELAGTGHLLPDSLIEVKPTGKTTGEVVWEWHLWDHLIQDHDSSKANYGDVSAHPELVDLNYAEDFMAPIVATKGGVDKLKSIGYVGATTTRRPSRANPDWTHVNSVDYNPELDQVMISVHEFSEVWIIDHSTTTAEAAGHTGGRSGKGGDLLYRWGNPRTYRLGNVKDQRLFAQHNAQWIPKGLPGAGHMLVYNNGGRRPDGNYSSVDEIVLPVDAQGKYTRKDGAAFGPDRAIWSYSAPKKSEFFSMIISGAQRLPNGNTQICSGINGTIFEVTPEKDVVWKYVNPVKAPPLMGGPGGPGGPPRPNQVLPFFLRDMLGMSPEQKKELDALQKDVDETLDKSLTAEQKKQLTGRGFGGFPMPGQVMSASTQAMLKPTAEQKTQLSALQKKVDESLDHVLTADQKTRFKEMREDFARGGPPGFGPGPGGRPGPPGGAPGGPPGGPGGPPNFGPPGGAALFRAYRYGPDYPGLAGRDLTPGKTVEALQPKEPAKK